MLLGAGLCGLGFYLLVASSEGSSRSKWIMGSLLGIATPFGLAWLMTASAGNRGAVLLVPVPYFLYRLAVAIRNRE